MIDRDVSAVNTVSQEGKKIQMRCNSWGMTFGKDIVEWSQAIQNVDQLMEIKPTVGNI